ncbi:unnamed protein product [Cuscuta epithymum]|uniref:Uncharacterized protein n=1 Tax=Cuscuta epithymum TaxID=186058 RepID=A0AAV0EQP3_9ASTE|nr:unnamed protein product [Cuscuta epithymum]
MDAKRDMKGLAGDMEEAKALLNAVRKMFSDLEAKATKGEKVMQELAEVNERLGCRDNEIRALRAKVKAAEEVGVSFKKRKEDNPSAPFIADVSSIKKQGSIDFQRSAGMKAALKNTSQKFLSEYIGVFLLLE